MTKTSRAETGVSRLDMEGDEADEGEEGENSSGDDRCKLLVAGWRAGPKSVPVVVCQVGFGTNQSPDDGSCVVHFTCNRQQLSAAELLEVVRHSFFSGEPLKLAAPGECLANAKQAATANIKKQQEVTSSDNCGETLAAAVQQEVAEVTGEVQAPSNVIFLCGFELSARGAALESCGGRIPETITIDQAQEPRRKADPETRNDDDDDDDNDSGHHHEGLFRIRTLFEGVDDGQYAVEAERVFKAMARLARRRGRRNPWATVSIETFKASEASHHKAKTSKDEAFQKEDIITTTTTTTTTTPTAINNDGGPAERVGVEDDDIVFLEEVVDASEVQRVGEGDRAAELLNLI
jgi:hypothetical protein